MPLGRIRTLTPLTESRLSNLHDAGSIPRLVHFPSPRRKGPSPFSQSPWCVPRPALAANFVALELAATLPRPCLDLPCSATKLAAAAARQHQANMVRALACAPPLSQATAASSQRCRESWGGQHTLQIAFPGDHSGDVCNECQNFLPRDETSWHCSTCRNYALCDRCYPSEDFEEPLSRTDTEQAIDEQLPVARCVSPPPCVRSHCYEARILRLDSPMARPSRTAPPLPRTNHRCSCASASPTLRNTLSQGVVRSELGHAC